MKQIIRRTLRDSAVARWTVLLIVALTMMTGYVVAKEMSPLQFLLERPTTEGGMGWTGTEFGLFAGSRGFFNVFLLMLFVSGIVLDKVGVRLAGLLSCILMLAGAGGVYMALTTISPNGVSEWFGGVTVKQQVLVAAGAFAVFGIGYELCGITVSKVIVRWFTGRELALAMGVQVALARLGTALALAGSPVVAQRFSLPMPILLGVLSVGLGTVAYLVFCTMDRRLDAQLGDDSKETDSTADSQQQFRLRDLGITLRSTGFWLITLLCMLYYSALYPFLDFATKLMITKYGVSADWAGTIPALLPFTSIVLTPLFGAMYDRFRHGATIMIIGTVLLTAVLAVFALPITSGTLAIAMMLVLGVAFSLLPAVLWPAVPKIVPLNQLGTAYSIIYYIQNIGLMVVPVVVGALLQRHTSANGEVDYTAALLLFTAIGVAAIVVSVLLLRADREHGYCLETPDENH